MFINSNRIFESNSESTKQDKVCYLTFDDGPSKNTEKVLDILAQYDAKATFFLIGNEVTEDWRAVLERMQEEGHAIGLHSNVHKFDKLYVSEEVCLQDYNAEYEKLKQQYGIDTKMFRFPGGSTCSCIKGEREVYIRIMEENGYRCFDWNVSGEDSVGKPTVWSIQKHVFDDVFDRKKPIVLLHDSKIAGTTVEALPGIMERLKEEGYTFATLEEIESYTF